MSERKQTHLGVEVGSLGDEGGEGRVELRRETTARVAPRSVELEQEPAASTKGREMGASSGGKSSSLVSVGEQRVGVQRRRVLANVESLGGSVRVDVERRVGAGAARAAGAGGCVGQVSQQRDAHPSAAPRLPSVSSLSSARLNQLPLTSLFLFCSSHTSLGRRTSRGSAR